ncbi:MAG: class I SAM-dependent methyltransferase [Gammaproteobacteria bacterium]
MFDLEAGNFWFKARSRLVNMMMKKYFPKAKNLLEIGCGTGYMLSEIEKAYPDMQLSGSEILSTGLGFAAKRVQKATLFQMDARQIPFENEFDVIGAFDVIEHIEEDQQVLSEMHQAVHADGGIILTVPQHKWLWSHVDEYAHHKRRYQAKELRKRAEQAGFRVLRMTSFVSLLLPLMYFSRLRNRRVRQGYDDTAELRVNSVVNGIMGWLMNLERLLMKSGVPFPAGGSLLLVAQKVP